MDSPNPEHPYSIVTGQELVEHLKQAPPLLLIQIAINAMTESSPFLRSLPQDKEHSAPIVLLLVCEEMTRRYSEFAAAQERAQELLKKVMEQALIEEANSTPPDERS